MRTHNKTQDFKNRLKIAAILILIGIPILYIKDCQGQELTDIPFKNAKQIVIICEDSNDDLYQRIGKHLSLAGYSVEDSNKDFLTFKTASRETSKFNYSYRISVVISGNTIVLSPQWKVNSSLLVGTRETAFYDWEYSKSNNNVGGIVHKDIMQAISDFSKVSVKYR